MNLIPGHHVLLRFVLRFASPSVQFRIFKLPLLTISRKLIYLIQNNNIEATIYQVNKVKDKVRQIKGIVCRGIS